MSLGASSTWFVNTQSQLGSKSISKKPGLSAACLFEGSASRDGDVPTQKHPTSTDPKAVLLQPNTACGAEDSLGQGWMRWKGCNCHFDPRALCLQGQSSGRAAQRDTHVPTGTSVGIWGLQWGWDEVLMLQSSVLLGLGPLGSPRAQGASAAGAVPPLKAFSLGQYGAIEMCGKGGGESTPKISCGYISMPAGELGIVSGGYTPSSSTFPSSSHLLPQMSPELSKKYRSEMRTKRGSQSSELKAKSTHQV